ncbi:phosphoserine phosphatase SerB [Glaciimonas immobilis]|uniref:Phosphoserine phosphatase n=1 Tax=Glaciimonas immobilis TaxID=728004 RepID=A0A840RPJ5_9BURK|nr:phosphoserine phosphatase SerB [Glaciimonas immobilis]KAF3999007.1 phosphoserine phosphatase SerB [Glaciimonas immobilis]MBB5198429.1 phosphoserine phosphatase [Glaciimonas immobilis]
MNLVLQSLHQDRAAATRIAKNMVQSIAPLAGSQLVDISATAWRCEGVEYSDALKAAIDTACHAAQFDYAFVPSDRTLSDFKLLAMDMDSTLITIECIDEIADMQGLKPQVAAITEAAMRGELEFNDSLIARVALLKGLDASALQRVYEERLQLSPGAEIMLAAIQAAGIKTLLVSGGFTFFTDRIKTRLGIDYTHANVLEIVDGRLTGNVIGDIVNAEEKQNTVARVCAQLGVTPKAAIVMGDGANDLKMMHIAGLSVAFRAKPLVRAQASVALNFVGLDGILPILGC